jgi:hypothetical protein
VTAELGWDPECMRVYDRPAAPQQVLPLPRPASSHQEEAYAEEES